MASGAKPSGQHRGAGLRSTLGKSIILWHEGAHERCSWPDGQVACGNLRVSHVFSLIMLLDRGIEVHAWLCGWIAARLSVCPRKGLRRAGLGVWYAGASHGCLSKKTLTP